MHNKFAALAAKSMKKKKVKNKRNGSVMCRRLYCSEYTVIISVLLMKTTFQKTREEASVDLVKVDW